MTDLGTLIGEHTLVTIEANKNYARKKELEFEIAAYMAEKYPDDFKRLQNGKVTTFKAEGVQLSTERKYDLNKLRAVVGETHPEIIKQATTEKADGNALRRLWSDAEWAEKLRDTLVPQNITVKVVG